MKRQILFRGKRIDNGEWVEGYYYVDRFGIACIITASGEHTEVIPETVGQYTGYNCKGEAKVFEGHIISKGRYKLTIIYDEVRAQFIAVGGSGNNYALNEFNVGKDFEIIGNTENK